MTNQAEYMITKNEIEKDEVLVEALKLKRVEVFKPINSETAEMYSLVLKDDLLPSLPEKQIGKCGLYSEIFSITLFNCRFSNKHNKTLVFNK